MCDVVRKMADGLSNSRRVYSMYETIVLTVLQPETRPAFRTACYSMCVILLITGISIATIRNRIFRHIIIIRMIFSEVIIRNVSNMPHIKIGGRDVNNLRYADHTVLITVSDEDDIHRSAIKK